MADKETPTRHQHHQQRDKENDDKYWPYIAALVAFITVAMTFVLLSGQTKKNVVWDLEGLEQELADRVYGQDEALNKITRVLRSVVGNTDDNPRSTLVILLGGPGVGKDYVLKIIERHVKCTYSYSAEDTCELKFSNFKWSNVSVNLNTKVLSNEYNGSRIMTAEFSSLDLVLHSSGVKSLLDQIDVDISHSNITFITGNIMSEWTVKNLINSKHYENYLFYEASKLEKLIHERFPNYNNIIVMFKPMGAKDVKKCMKDQEINIKLIDSGKDFVPLGCKTHLGSTTCVNC